jgi:large subunit ribosomal protein L7Ae
MKKPEDVMEIIEISRDTGKIKKGVNEATKAIERGTAKLVVVAEDVDPAEIIMHLEPLCDEKKIPLVRVPNRSELGRAAGIDVSAAAIAVTDAGDAKGRLQKLLKE